MCNCDFWLAAKPVPKTGPHVKFCGGSMMLFFFTPTIKNDSQFYSKHNNENSKDSRSVQVSATKFHMTYDLKWFAVIIDCRSTLAMTRVLWRETGRGITVKEHVRLSGAEVWKYWRNTTKTTAPPSSTANAGSLPVLSPQVRYDPHIRLLPHFFGTWLKRHDALSSPAWVATPSAS